MNRKIVLLLRTYKIELKIIITLILHSVNFVTDLLIVLINYFLLMKITFQYIVDYLQNLFMPLKILKTYLSVKRYALK